MKHFGKIATAIIILLMIVGGLWVKNNFSMENIVATTKEEIKKEIASTFKEAKKGAVNKAKDYLEEHRHRKEAKNEFEPKGNKEEFCNKNSLMFPTLNQGYGNDFIKLCYSGYTAMFKPEYNISLWVAEKLTPEREEASKGGERESTFYPDPTVLAKTGHAIKTEDYIGASNGKLRYDRGHLAPSRDMPLEDRYESFYMSNIVPQSANNNRNVWADIEKTARCMSKEEVYTVTVPVIDIKKHQSKNKLPVLQTKNGDVIIPDYMAKGIYVPKTGEIGVYLTKNDESKTNYDIISVNDLKAISFIDIFPQLNEELKNKKSAFPKPGKCK